MQTTTTTQCPKGFQCPSKDACEMFHPTRLCRFGNACTFRKKKKCLYKHNIDISCRYGDKCRFNQEKTCEFFHEPEKKVRFIVPQCNVEILSKNPFSVLEDIEPQDTSTSDTQVNETSIETPAESSTPSTSYANVLETSMPVSSTPVPDTSKTTQPVKMEKPFAVKTPKSDAKTGVSNTRYKMCKFQSKCHYKKLGKCNFLHNEDIFPFNSFDEFKSKLVVYLNTLSQEYQEELVSRFEQINEKRSASYQVPLSYQDFKGHDKYIVTDINIDFSLMEGAETDIIKELFPLIVNETLQEYNRSSEFVFIDASNIRRGKKLVISIKK